MYKSKKQERFFHTQTAKDKGITKDVVNEFDQASKGMNLPEVAKPTTMHGFAVKGEHKQI